MASHRITGGDHDGMTLGELAETDILAALDIYNNHRDGQRAKQDAEVARREEVDREGAEFLSDRAKEAFGKDFNDLTTDEEAQVRKLGDVVAAWMVETNRGGGIIEDGYYLMNKDNLLEQKQGEALKSLVAALKDPGTPSISIQKTTPTKGGFSRFLNYTSDEAAAEMDKMNEAEEDEFYKKAPAEVRKKFPSLPWPDA